ncbi:PREDICTED: larval cuticle protein A2B-like, partial [Nicrophorus vespilloides]|uniref:Larval cuticle protein A2B-like n=1 Tax=Nicrophorus vespilloides TaxID=110193 RepID=A0ABM1MWN5_NICVS
ILAVSALIACAQAGIFDLGHQSTSYSDAPIAHYEAPIHNYNVVPAARYTTPVYKTVQKKVYPDTYAQYSYGYGVQDPSTGDYKNQHEERDGDVVRGYYSLVQPDGVTRIVHYTADALHGFRAHVEYKGQPIVQTKVFVPVKTLVPQYPGYHH